MKLCFSMSDAFYSPEESGSDLLLRGMFSTLPVCTSLNDQAQLKAMVAFEVALAQAEATLGLIPEEAAQGIAAHAQVENLDIPALALEARAAGNVAIPFVKRLTALIAEQDTEAARYVHWGATSQDVLDTATVLQLRNAVSYIRQDCIELEHCLAGLVIKYQDTILPGRTWLQHAVPTTFGLKAAGWLTAASDARYGLEGALQKACMLQFGGAAGTLASLQNRGLGVAECLARSLDLTLPPLPWHTLRGPLVECGSALGLLCGVMGKLARDLSLMMQTEVAELSPPGGKAQGGSSTMPHKKNPVDCAIALSVATQAPGLVSTLFSCMVQEHERGLGGWHAEWQTLPALLRLTAASVERMKHTVTCMQVLPAVMGHNLEKTHGLTMAESVSMALAVQLGKEKAHHILQELSHQATDNDQPLFDFLMKDSRITTVLSYEKISSLMNPSHYLGSSQVFCERALEAWRKRNNAECL